MWTVKHVGHGEAPVINYSGGTEVGGGILASTLLKPMKAGCFHGPIAGTGAAIVRGDGTDAGVGEIGELVMRQPSPGLTRGLWHDPERYLETYWSQIPGVWTQGDLASRDEDGCWFLHGRSDDTIKVSGKRIGPAEIEAALVGTGEVLDAAAIAIPDEQSGNAIVCAVILAPKASPSPERAESLRAACANAIGSSFRPKQILFVTDLPRTRNMKVMRRLIRNALLGLPEGDTTALLNPDAVQELRGMQLKVTGSD